MKKIRCAIYTRKSAEEGLEQEFNSLDAQREACAAYVASQSKQRKHQHRTRTRLDWLPLRAVRRTGHLVRSWANLVPAIIQRSPAASYADGDGAGLRFSVSLGDSSVSSDRGDTVESTEANRERHDTGRNEERTGALAS